MNPLDPGAGSVASLQEAGFRYERKFFVSELSRAQIESVVRLHPALFRPIFHARQVDNIYLDTTDLAAYRENSIGFSEGRTKVRIRWYGELLGKIERPTLEFKTRWGLLNRKRSYPLPAFELDSGFRRGRLVDVLARAELPQDERERLAGLEPVLINHYLRSYWRSADGLFRLTIDSDLAFLGVRLLSNSFLLRAGAGPACVVELKYPPQADELAHELSSRFPFRMTRSSKYTLGIERIGRV